MIQLPTVSDLLIRQISLPPQPQEDQSKGSNFGEPDSIWERGYVAPSPKPPAQWFYEVDLP